MGLVVTGISQNGDVSRLEKALSDAGFSVEPLQTINPGDGDATLAEVAGGARLDTHLNLGDGQGTGVPGITSASPSIGTMRGSRTYFHNEELWDRLGDFEIPDDEVENYIEAVQAGRSVVAYFAHKPENVPKLEGLFRSCGLMKVKTF
jgi:hypothetical protein